MLGTPHLAGTRYSTLEPGTETSVAAQEDPAASPLGHPVRPEAGPAGHRSHRAARPARRRRALRKPVFIDRTGWRGRLVAALAAGITLACLGYLVFLGTLVAGVWRPAATSPPRVEESVVPRPARSPGGVVRRSSGTVPGRSTEARSAGAAGQQAR